jgi:hypothetical protein
MRYIAMGLAVAVMLTLATPPVQGGIRGPAHNSATGGFCPQGSCAPSGGPYAKNVAKCSPAHCRR